MRKIIFILLFLGIPAYMKLFLDGYFHFKTIYINNIAVDLPKDIYLCSASVNYESIQDIFSPLPFREHINHYNFLNNDLISLTFTSKALKDGTHNVMHLELDPTYKTQEKSEKLILSLLKDEKYRKINGLECLEYYVDGMNPALYIFHRDKKGLISIMSNDSEITSYVGSQICGD